MYKLRSTLTGHELDVRSVTAVSNNTIVSGSRDGTARLWDLSFNLDVSTNNEICFLSPTSSFVNAVAAVDIDPAEPLVAVGGKDAVIYLLGTHDTFAKPGEDFGKYQLPGHQGNVCSLDYRDNVLVSGSWDCTAKAWDLLRFEVKHDLVGHLASVWDAKVIGPDTYLTCSADRTIRKWVGDREVAQYVGHNDVVRKLLVLPDQNQFVSASNDCTLKVWDLATGTVLHTLLGHQLFVYDVAALPNGDLVSTAEDRTVRVWRNGKVLQAITLPCISVWCVAVLPNGDFAVGGSDKQIYVFTASDDRAATALGILAFNDLVRLSAISEQSLDDLKKTDIPGYDRLDHPGKEEGSTIMVKSPAGVIEAHQWSGGAWVKIGDVVDSAGGSLGKKEYKGKEYDYVFDVDVEDGKPPLKLPYNANENPYTAAERFLADNDLPGSYADEVVRFINQNTSGFQLDQQGSQETAPPAPPAAATPAPAISLLPQTVPITYKDFKPEQLVKGFAKFNGSHDAAKSFDASTASKVERALSNMKSKDAIFLITDVIPKILGQWDTAQKLIAFDMLRISIPRVTTVDLLQSTDAAESVLKLLLDNLAELKENDLSLIMMVFKVLSNLTTSMLFAQLFLTVEDKGALSLNTYFDDLADKISVLVAKITSLPDAASHKHFKLAVSSIAAFLYNLSVYAFSNKTVKSTPASLASAAQIVNNVGESLVAADEEAAYRLCITLGNFKVAKVVENTPSWLAASKEKYTAARFKDVYAELDKF